MRVASAILTAWRPAMADTVCGAEFGTISAEQVSRNFDTRSGTPDITMPKLRREFYLPD